jgi:hypothetical protein
MFARAIEFEVHSGGVAGWTVDAATDLGPGRGGEGIEKRAEQEQGLERGDFAAYGPRAVVAPGFVARGSGASVDIALAFARRDLRGRLAKS